MTQNKVWVDSGQVWMGDLVHCEGMTPEEIHDAGGVVCSVAPGQYGADYHTVEMWGSRRVTEVRVVPDPNGSIHITSGTLVFIDPCYVRGWGGWGDGGLYDACCQVTMQDLVGSVAEGLVCSSGLGDGDYPVTQLAPDTYQILFT